MHVISGIQCGIFTQAVGYGGEGELIGVGILLIYGYTPWALIGMILLFTGLILIQAVLGFLMGSLIGSLLMMMGYRKRELIWKLPILNIGWYLILRWAMILIWSDTPYVSEIFWLDWVGVGLMFFGAMIVLLLFSPIQLLLRRGTGKLAEREASRDDPKLDELLRRPIDPTWFGRFVEGMRTPLHGLNYMNRHPTLWRHGVMPVIVNLLVTTLALFFLIILAIGTIILLHPYYGTGWWWVVLEVVVAIVVIALAGLIALGVYILFQGIFCGHYYAKLVEQLERDLGLDESEIREVTFRFQVIDACRDLSMLIGVQVGLLLFHLIPVLGSVIALVGGAYWACWVLGKDFMDHPLNLRGWSWAEKRKFNVKHRPLTIGLGCVVIVISLIPIVNAILLTTAATGSVLLHRRLTRDDDSAATLTQPTPASPDPTAEVPVPSNST